MQTKRDWACLKNFKYFFSSSSWLCSAILYMLFSKQRKAFLREDLVYISYATIMSWKDHHFGHQCVVCLYANKNVLTAQILSPESLEQKSCGPIKWYFDAHHRYEQLLNCAHENVMPSFHGI